MEKEQLREILKNDFPLFAKTCLKVLDKDSQLKPFILNPVQLEIHNILEKQKREMGKVRAIILKGRQQGCSTLISGRFYFKTTMATGQGVRIICHRVDAVNDLFNIAKRLHTHDPLQPQIANSNKKELVFQDLDSRYTVNSAGGRGSGRGSTNQYLHISEAGFFPPDTDTLAASVQAIPPDSGEIIVESTSGGAKGILYDMWQAAIRGESEYIPIFMPWFKTPQYQKPVPEGFQLSKVPPLEGLPSESEYAEIHKLTDEQMLFRRHKIAETGIEKWMREYPATATEAFQATNSDAFIKSLAITKAMKHKTKGGGYVIFGIDPAGFGGGRFAVCVRQGARVRRIHQREGISAPDAHEWIKSLIEKYKPRKVFIDSGGLGQPIIDYLKGDCEPHLISAVNFGAASQFKRRYPKRAGALNRRSEMYLRLKQWIEDEETAVDIPDDDELFSDLVSVVEKDNFNGDLVLVSKGEMKKKGLRSPDLADALALTFAEVVRPPIDTSKLNSPRMFGGWMG